MLLRQWYILLFSVVVSNLSLAKEWSYSVDYIQGEGDVQGVKLAVQYHTDWLEQYSDSWQVYFESSVNTWEYGAENQYDTNFVLAISPVFQYPIATSGNQQWFVEAGIGISLLDDTTFAGKNVSTHYQFEDRIGITTRFGKHAQHKVSLRYFHYSNAGIKKPNPGLDFIALSYMRFFQWTIAESRYTTLLNS